ncbi:DgyrCDS12990 [Dimorphilus gyrociliatus]|uniref:DgyrCDS12990 n=1 Tax=Dimorphilus gyrociliatus TaxID=2664684 RepID=A0A7I8W9E0_9ANNE|nr:DgyrCDS12990 [Dimorphilus gyrociliatus]
MNTTISPSTPEYFMYSFGKEDSVLITIESPDDLCMHVSVQDRKVDDSALVYCICIEALITFGSIINKKAFPGGFFLVFVASLTKSDCTKAVEKHPGNNTKKFISFTVKSALPKSKYWEPILFAIAWFLLFYIVAMVICCICYFTLTWNRFKKNVSQPLVTERNDGMRSPIVASEGQMDGYGATTDAPQSTGIPHVIRRQSSDSSLNEDDFDTLNDAESDKNVFRSKNNI